ncbi:hypothetical protein GCM10027566_37440 [Arachidicoccus ginsenosidivorans]|uniref:Uncharacterized protein n=1 Tax=Arachidicoccus ginsenosidivorans TaxID=496057 RepID=A0A5B8VLD4_9BACT|nr:hypothetical protein [Arachidicoccus ginsenosidivorans]QEC72320.1 hypothetical protein FSB73_12210 [Arachidicoccus ginsenosidivorans]
MRKWISDTVHLSIAALIIALKPKGYFSAFTLTFATFSFDSCPTIVGKFIVFTQNNTQMAFTYLYIRVSTDEQKRKGYFRHQP